MKDLQLTGALDGLKVLDLSDLSRYKLAVDKGQQAGWGYYFPNLLTYNRPGRGAALIAEDGDSVCVYRWVRRNSGPRLDLLLAPTPMDARVLQRSLERANDFNGDFSARVLRLDAKDAAAAASLSDLHIREHKSQYLYSPQSFADISGRKYRTLRRNVQGVEALPDVEVLPYSELHAEGCRELLRRWSRRHRATHGTQGGVGTTGRALELPEKFTELDLRGEVVLIDGRLAAFAFGGEIRPGMGAFLDAKCDIEVQGLSYFHRYSFLSKLRHFELVNDGSDVGREGLRQLKNSLRPVGMHTEYRGTQLRAQGLP
ncbi:MAG: DUF2156 domain-containing protein [Deltaproteobacteria bacterium]|nr:DUF2156 domain-containing protein [Deltaproteobacteria bacterium]